MPLDDNEVKELSDANEAEFKEQFEKLGYVVQKLDRSNENARPDFLVSNSSGPQMLCEVKTIVSAGYLRDKIKGDIHISMLDKKLVDVGVFKNEIDVRKLDARLKNALRQRAALVGDESKYAKLPLLIAFSFDFFADYLLFYPRCFDERDERFREVSGILTIVKDVERSKAFKELSREEQRRRIKAELERANSTDTKAEVIDDLPPHSTDFMLVPNQAAIRPVPKDFARQCLPDDYYG